MPDEPEVIGLLAMMLLTDARVPAREADGHVVLLKGHRGSLRDPVGE
ncbi:hypothetical protein OG558_22150 [Kribbella sp. NBC_01510]